jgi:predicted transcriptional regulator
MSGKQSRVSKGKDVDSTLLSIINEIPGIRFMELARLTGFSNGLLTYHLTALEKSNSLRIDRKPRVTRYYPSNLSVEESMILEYLRREQTRKIIAFCLISKKGATFHEIVEHIDKASSTVSVHIRKLKDAGILSVKHVGNQALYMVADDGLVTNVLSKTSLSARL